MNFSELRKNTISSMTATLISVPDSIGAELSIRRASARSGTYRQPWHDAEVTEIDDR